jgi:predicted nucleic acid-binding protein
MGLILDSSIVIASERRRETVERLIGRVVTATGDQEAALSTIGVTELIHGLYRAQTPALRLRRQSFLDELMKALTVYPYTKETAMLAGKLDGEQQSKGVVIPFGRLAHRRDSVGSRLFRADRKSAPLPENPRSFRNSTLKD